MSKLLYSGDLNTNQVVYLCIIFKSMHIIFALPGWRHACILKKEGVSHLGLVFSVCLFAHLLCVHTIFEQNFIFPLFCSPSRLHWSSPSFHQNTSPKWLTPLFSICIRDIMLCMHLKMIHKYTTNDLSRSIPSYYFGNRGYKNQFFTAVLKPVSNRSCFYLNQVHFI